MRVLVTIGTRPEAIKMAPLIKRLKHNNEFEVGLCNTGQHQDLLDPILDFFDLKPDFDLNVMKANQGLHELTSNILLGVQTVLESYKPDYVLVHGDTTTSFATSLAAYYCKVKVAHVEAGLRTHDKYQPFPEEINRSLNGRLADIHFSPTMSSKENLLLENIKDEMIVLTGNTVIDALFDALDLISDIKNEKMEGLIKGKRVILFTGHRRENFGKGFNDVFRALAAVADENEDVIVIYPVHPNPNVKAMAKEFFKNNGKISLIEPLNYGDFIWLMQRSHLVITDSGGIQEEAPSLGKPVLVVREVTERPEAVQSGTVILVGTDFSLIKDTANRLLNDDEYYNKISSIQNPYGDGKASERIIDYLIRQKTL
jgi:UDP-N-acetylglucosamine 2-epimerase (non-hydrolysing)